jgi:hypothetical protein
LSRILQGVPFFFSLSEIRILITCSQKFLSAVYLCVIPRIPSFDGVPRNRTLVESSSKAMSQIKDEMPAIRVGSDKGRYPGEEAILPVQGLGISENEIRHQEGCCVVNERWQLLITFGKRSFEFILQVFLNLPD